eukprot:TRINITY_DN4967_c1_g1_i7.p1 TRINITY_DN4967_c1_g1~~TRINITY_DN4967_c1_g1_i7.p1  ORF type:complete len:651 (+),score=196.01 TRINITY_DN4967_c1_g1_i7:74-2026(+)
MEQGVMVRGISSAEASKFETLFRLLDSEGTGTINEKELADLMPRMGVFLSESELHLLFQSVDIDGSGGIDFPEFLQLMSRHREANQLTLLEGGRTVFKELQTASKTKFVLRPDDPVNWACDLIVMGAVVFYIGMVIYEDVKQADILQAVPMKVFWAAVMALDLFRGAVTSHPPEDSDTLPVDNLNFAMKGYLHSNKFLLDFIAAFPLDCIFMATGQPRPMRAAQHLRLMKAFCVRHLFKLSARDILSPAYTRFHFSIVPLIRIVFWAMIVVHLLSVTWILISPGLDVPYIEAVYFVVYTLTTTGYGDITVETDIQRCFAVFLFCCASVVTGLVVGKLVQFSQQADLQTDSDKRMLETLAALNHLTIPQDFKEEVLAFQLHRLKHSNSLFNDAVSGLPQVMQDRMALYARMKIVRQVPIFSKAPEICVAKLAQSLINVVVPPEEYIVIAGEEGEEMFFLFHGMCGVWLPVSGSGKWIATIKRGGVFGEVALLEETRRSASIKSLTYCQLFRLDKAAFLNIVDNFPALLESIQSVSVVLQYTKPQTTPPEVPTPKNRMTQSDLQKDISKYISEKFSDHDGRARKRKSIVIAQNSGELCSIQDRVQALNQRIESALSEAAKNLVVEDNPSRTGSCKALPTMKISSILHLNPKK